MARDPDAMRLIAKWAAQGDRVLPENRPNEVIDRDTGWTSEWSRTGGQLPSREVFNQLFAEFSALGAELNAHGLLEWHSSLAYTHPALVFGSDGALYLSVRDSQGQDPTVEISPYVNWRPFAGRGWVPRYGLATDGDREVMQLLGWRGGSGARPTAGVNQYLSETGEVANIADGKNLRGPRGERGATGPRGPAGRAGSNATLPSGTVIWTPTSVSPAGFTRDSSNDRYVDDNIQFRVSTSSQLGSDWTRITQIVAPNLSPRWLYFRHDIARFYAHRKT